MGANPLVAYGVTPDGRNAAGTDRALRLIRDLAAHEADDTPRGLVYDQIAKLAIEEVGE